MSDQTQAMSAQELFDYAKSKGIAEGLRMAAEIVRQLNLSGMKIGDSPTGLGIYSSILAKAKEVEEGKGEK